MALVKISMEWITNVFVILAGEEKLAMNAVHTVNAPIKKPMLATSQMNVNVKPMILIPKVSVPKH